jgi:hypothetical protein
MQVSERDHLLNEVIGKQLEENSTVKDSDK